MTNSDLLQARINELNSAILNFSNDKVYITGFYSPEMLLLHVNEGRDNHQSKGVYDRSNVNFWNVQNNALFIIQEDGIEKERIQYKRIFKDTLKPIDKKQKIMVSIYENIFSSERVIRTEKRTLSFPNSEKMLNYLNENYTDVINFEGSEQYVYSSN